jgi:chromosome partitioning protein
VITIAISNQKGGVGKTTLARELAASFGKRGFTVLAVDMDFQHNLTTSFIGVEPARLLPASKTTAAIAAGESEEIESIATNLPMVRLLPCSRSAVSHDLSAPLQNPDAPISSLAIQLGRYARVDIALVDTRPDANLMGMQSLYAADYVLVPVMPDEAGVLGLGDVLAIMAQLRQTRPNCEAPRDLGIVINRFKNNVAIHGAYEQILRAPERYGPLVLTQKIHDYTSFPLSWANRSAVEISQPKSDAAVHIGALAEEILGRIGLRRNH